MTILHLHSAELTEEVDVTAPLDLYSKDFELDALKSGCFYCGEKFDPDVAVIMWSGSSQDEKSGVFVYLHAPCVSPLFIRLARDVLEWENVYAGGTRRLDQIEMPGRISLRKVLPAYQYEDED